MAAAAESLLAALRERGDAPCLRLAHDDVSAAGLVGGVEEAVRLTARSPVALGAGDVVAFRGAHPAMQVAGPLAAWSADLCTYALSPREPDARVRHLLQEVGCKLLLTWSEGG